MSAAEIRLPNAAEGSAIAEAKPDRLLALQGGNGTDCQQLTMTLRALHNRVRQSVLRASRRRNPASEPIREDNGIPSRVLAGHAGRS